MARRLILLIMVTLLCACRVSNTSERINLLQGTWRDDDVTVAIDLMAKLYIRTDSGKTIKRQIDRIEDRGDFFVLTLDGNAIRADMYERNSLVLLGTPEGALTLERVLENK